MGGKTKTAADVQAWIDAGVTWWLESMWDTPKGAPDRVLARIRQGPPR